MDVSRIDLMEMRTTTDCTDCLYNDFKALVVSKQVKDWYDMRNTATRLSRLSGSALQDAVAENFDLLNHCVSIQKWLKSLDADGFEEAMDDLETENIDFDPESFAQHQEDEGAETFRYAKRRMKEIITKADTLMQRYGFLASLMLESLPATYRMQDIADILIEGQLRPKESTKDAAHRISRTARDTIWMFKSPGYAAYVGYVHELQRRSFSGKKYAGVFKADVNPPLNQLTLVYTSLTFSLGVIRCLETGWLGEQCIVPSMKYLNAFLQMAFGNQLQCSKIESTAWIQAWAILGSLVGIDRKYNPTTRKDAEAT